MAEFDALFRCTLGGTGFQLRDYGYKEEPIVEDKKGQTGVTITVTGEGYVEEADAATFAAALGATASAFRVHGQTFTLYGLYDSVEVTVLAGQCVDGGPYVTFEILPQGSGSRLVKEFKFVLTAKKAILDGDGKPTNAYKIKVVTGPDGLRKVTVSGELKGPGCSAFFETGVLPKFNASYDVVNWVPTISLEVNQTDDDTTYTLEYRELFESLPDPGPGTAVDGTATDSTERDEQMRKVRIITFDMLVVGDPMAVRDFMRGLLGATPFKERFEVTRYDQQRVRGEFQLLTGDGGSDLLNWERSIEAVEQQTDTFTAFAVPGTTPIFVKTPFAGFTYIDSGSAIGAGRSPKPPAPLYNTFGAPHDFTYTDLNSVEKRTSWKYTYLLESPVESPKTFAASLVRPANPEFLN